jgi:hypothetical protein
MRVKLLLVGGLALLLGSCSAGGGSHAPPPLKKELLTGKWKTSTDTLFIAGYEFADGGAMKMNIRSMKQPITGTYAWDGDRSLRLKYDLPPDVRKAYDEAAKAFKDDVVKKIEAKTLPDKAGPSLLGSVPDELPVEETVQVGISEKPPLLFLSTLKSGQQTYERVAN